jgi:hypothetical protein
VLKLRVLRDFKTTIHDAERKLKGQREDPLMAEALQWGEAFIQKAWLASNTEDRWRR